MKILENNKMVLVKGNVIGFEESTLEPLKYLVQFPDLTTASLYVDMIEDEPQKPVVPQFVAKHIERSKKIGRDLQDSMNSSLIYEEVDQWLYTNDNMDTFARAWLDGYEVEEAGNE